MPRTGRWPRSFLDFGNSLAFPRKRLVQDFTNRFCGSAVMTLTECRDNPVPHISRVHEQVFQFHGVDRLDPGGEAGKQAVLFRDMSAAFGSPLWPQDQVLMLRRLG